MSIKRVSFPTQEPVKVVRLRMGLLICLWLAAVFNPRLLLASNGEWMPEATVATDSSGGLFFFPDIQVDPSGTPQVILIKEVSGDGQPLAFFQTHWTGELWSPLERLFPDNLRSGTLWTEFVFLHSDTTCLVFDKGTYPDGDIYSSFSQGGSWTEPLRVDAATGREDLSPRLASSSNSLWVVWYSLYPDGTHDVFCSRWSGNAWTPEFNITAGIAGDHWFADAEADSKSAVHVVWEDLSSFSLLYSTSLDGITWSSPIELNSPDLDIYAAGWAAPSIAIDSMDQLHVAWVGMRLLPGGGFGDWDIYYSKRGLSGWSDPIQVNVDDSASDQYPRVAVSSPDNVWITWNKEVAFWDARIMATHFDGIGWSDEIRIDGSNYEADEAPRLALDQEGLPWVVWQSIREGYLGQAIEYSRYKSSGTPVLLRDLLGTVYGSDSVRLSWESDGNAFSYFWVQESYEGKPYQDIDSVPDLGVTRHSWTRSGLAPGEYKYRIEGILKSGEAVFLGPVTIRIPTGPDQLIVSVLSKLPASNSVRLRLGIPFGGEVRMDLLNVQGRILGEWGPRYLESGWTEESWQLSGRQQRIPAGVYFIRVRLVNLARSFKLTVLP